MEAKSFVGRIFKKFELDMVLWIEPLNFQSREGMTCLRAIVKSEKNAVKVPPLEVPRLEATNAGQRLPGRFLV